MRRSLVLLAQILSISTGAAFADYGIVLDDTCLTMLQNNINANCPNYEQIMILFPDTTNQDISGHFIYKNGIIQRQEPQLEKHLEYYRYDSKDTLWIDPPGDVLEKINLITITSYDFTYKIGNQVITNNTILIGQSRFISKNCDSAIITSKNYLFLLGDTMRFLKRNCDPSQTNFDETKIRTWERTKHDITTSYKWKLDQWIKESKTKCVNKCFEY